MKNTTHTRESVKTTRPAVTKKSFSRRSARQAVVPPPPDGSWPKGKLFWAALVAVVLLGGLFRFYNLNWDHYHSFHPDERNILGQTAGIQANDGYRVKFFAYGQLPVYLYRSTAAVLSVPHVLAPSGVTPGVQGFWWAFLAALFGILGWVLSKSRWKPATFSVVTALFVPLVLFFFFRIFKLWAGNLEGFSLGIATFLFLPAAALIGLAFWAEVFDEDRRSMPWLNTAGVCLGLSLVVSALAFGLSREFLNGAFVTIARSLVIIGFTATLLLLGLWFAWVSRWGRVLLGLFSAWALLAFLPPGNPHFLDYKYEMVIGRHWAALFSTLTILAVFFLVQRLYKRPWMALIAATAFAFAVISIQVSHYCITESLITLMGVVMAFTAFEIAEKGSWRAYLVAGAAFGIALASKTSSLYFVVMIVGSHLLWLAKKDAAAWRAIDKRTGPERRLWHSMGAVALIAGCFLSFVFVAIKFRGIFRDLYVKTPGTGLTLWILLAVVLVTLGALLAAWGIKEFKVVRAQVPTWIPMTAVAGLAFFLFCLLSPWSLLARDEFMRSMNYEWDVVSLANACYVFQFKDTPRYIFHLQNLIQVNLWWPLGVTAVLGMLWVYLRFFMGLRPSAAKGGTLPVPFMEGRSFGFHPADFVLLLWFTSYFGFIGMWNTKFIRYMVPLIPFFCVFGARLMCDLFERLKGQGGKVVRALVLLLVLGGSLFYSLAYMSIYRNPHTWIEASVWMFKNIPFGSFVLTEHWDDGLPTGVNPTEDPRVDKGYGPQNYRQESVPIYDQYGLPTADSPMKKESYINLLTRADYLTISSKKLWYTITHSTPEFKGPNGFNTFPVSSRYYRLLWTGQLGYKMVKDVTNYPRLFGWSHPDDMAEESFSVYDHPRSYIFKKVENVSPERMRALLSSDDYVKGVDREMMRKVTAETVDRFIAEHRSRLEASGALSRLEAQMAQVEAPTPTPGVETREDRSGDEGENNAPVSRLDDKGAPPSVKTPPGVPGLPSQASLKVLEELAKNPVIEGDVPNESVFPKETTGYQLRAWATWWLLLVALGLMALPFTLRLMPGLMPGAYSLSKMLGMLFFSWLVWFAGNYVLKFTTLHCLVLLALFGGLAVFAATRWRRTLLEAFHKNGKSFLIQEGLFFLLFAFFVVVRMHNPHVHDPIGEGYSGGGEAGMDFGFLASVVRGESFPAQNMWMAGSPIGYSFYYGHLMMGILTKTLMLAPEVTYNLAVATLFALIFTGAFGIAYGLSGRLGGGLVAGFLCALAGNLSGAFQMLKYVVEAIRQSSLSPLMSHVFDYWGPSRVIPNSINEFPYFSVLFADMHAHTLAMPFAMLAIALVASLFLSPVPKSVWDKRSQAVSLPIALVFGFVFGSLYILNTWEMPVWAVLFLLALLVRDLPSLREKALRGGVAIHLLSFAVGLYALQVFARLMHYGDNQTLGGQTQYLALFGLLSLVVGLIVSLSRKETKPFGVRVTGAGVFFLISLLTAFVAWFPHFHKSYNPLQQSEVLWVMPTLRTALSNYWTIYGAFLAVMTLGFLLAYEKGVLRSLASGPVKAKKRRGDLFDRFVDTALDFFERARDLVTKPQGAVPAMMALGLLVWALVVGASWTHFVAPHTAWIMIVLAGLTLGALIAAIFLRDNLPVWIAFGGLALVWFLLMLGDILKLRDATTPMMGLGLFTALLLMGFFQLGMSLRVRKEAKLSFTFLLMGLFFLVTAGLEVFVMKEYLGGEWMRNNSLFKFGICAWTLASIATGALLPRLWDLIAAWGKVRKESLGARRILLGVAILCLFLILKMVLWEAEPLFQGNAFSIVNLLLGLAVVVVWAMRTGKGVDPVAIGAGVPYVALLLLPLLKSSFPAGLLGKMIRDVADLGIAVLFPLNLAVLAVLAAAYLWEKRSDLGRRLGVGAWKALLITLLVFVTVYPLFGTWRKCHGFWPVDRSSWIGYPEKPTLNGLTFIRRNNRHDAAAIRFLNDKVPGQPCLIETVGLGYNSWGSRYSIFTGIPALMGWDGHVSEWVGSTQSDRIRLRRQAVENIYNTTDKERAQELMDSYGVRLIVVGPLEKGALDPQKRYDAEGLAKFEGWLPTIYKNPGVTIYYNAPKGG